MIETILFIGLAVVSLVAAIGVVLPKNPIYSALSLLIMMLSLAGIFLQLAAPFLAIMQVVVYAGAVVTLFVFVIMLMNLDPVEMGEEKGLGFKVVCFFLALFLLLFVLYPIFISKNALPHRFPDRAKAGATPEGLRDAQIGDLVKQREMRDPVFAQKPGKEKRAWGEAEWDGRIGALVKHRSMDDEAFRSKSEDEKRAWARAELGRFLGRGKYAVPGTLVSSEWGEVPASFGSTESVGTVLFEPYLVPFELVSVLIVIAVVGAVVLSKKKLD